MKTLKIGVILLAFMLAAIVMVPMVNAEGQKVTAGAVEHVSAPTIDVNKFELPHLQVQ